jgi:hypothetical protein
MTLLAGVTATMLASVALASAASPGAADRAATRSYLQVQYELHQVELANLGASVSSDEQLAGRIKNECPNVAARAPRRSSQGAVLTAESMVAALLALTAPDRQALRLTASAARRLRWRDNRLTRLVHSAAAQDALGAQLAMPDLCGDWKAWVSSGYRTLSQGSRAFFRAVQRLFAHEPDKPLILSLLARYEGPSERAAARRLTRLEKQSEGRFTPAGNRAISAVLQALGLPPLPPPGSVRAKRR